MPEDVQTYAARVAAAGPDRRDGGSGALRG